MKRTVGLLLIAFALPVAVQGQYWEADPAKTYCTSITTDYCVSIFSIELNLYDVGESDPVWIFTGQQATVGVFGRAVKVTEPTRVRRMNSTLQTDCGPLNIRFFENLSKPIVNGVQTISEVGVAGSCAAQDADPGRFRSPTVDDFTGVIALRIGDTSGPSCVIGDTCVEVPEPGTYLLMLSGVLGLGFVALRRKEDLAA